MQHSTTTWCTLNSYKFLGTLYSLTLSSCMAWRMVCWRYSLWSPIASKAFSFNNSKWGPVIFWKYTEKRRGEGKGEEKRTHINMPSIKFHFPSHLLPEDVSIVVLSPLSQTFHPLQNILTAPHSHWFTHKLCTCTSWHPQHEAKHNYLGKGNVLGVISSPLI